MVHDAATPTALCRLDMSQAFPRTVTDKDAEGLTGCTMHGMMLTTARRRMTPQDAPCGARGAKGRQTRTDAIAAWRRHGGGASVSCMPTTPPCAGLGRELTSLEKVPSMPGRWAADAPFSDRRLSVVLPLLPPHSNPRGACAGSGLSGPYTHRAPFPRSPPRLLYTRSSTLSTPVPLTVATTDTCSTPVPCPVVPLRLPHPTSCRSPPKCFLHSRIFAPIFLDFPSALSGKRARRSPKPCVSGRARAIFGQAPRPTAPFRSHDPIIFESTPFLT